MYLRISSIYDSESSTIERPHQHTGTVQTTRARCAHVHANHETPTHKSISRPAPLSFAATRTSCTIFKQRKVLIKRTCICMYVIKYITYSTLYPKKRHTRNKRRQTQTRKTHASRQHPHTHRQRQQPPPPMLVPVRQIRQHLRNSPKLPGK